MLIMVLSMAMPWPRSWQKRWWKDKWRPYPRRHERKELVRRAQAQADDSRRRAEEAARIARELRRSSGDAVAESIIEGLRRDRRAPG